MAGAAFAHNFGLASSADGPTANGKIAVVIGIVVVRDYCSDQFNEKRRSLSKRTEEENER